jgi:hypothetical protein
VDPSFPIIASWERGLGCAVASGRNHIVGSGNSCLDAHYGAVVKLIYRKGHDEKLRIVLQNMMVAVAEDFISIYRLLVSSLVLMLSKIIQAIDLWNLWRMLHFDHVLKKKLTLTPSAASTWPERFFPWSWT